MTQISWIAFVPIGFAAAALSILSLGIDLRTKPHVAPT